MDSILLNEIFLVLCFGASFVLSGMEAGVFGLNRMRIRRLARNGKLSAQILNRFLEKPERFLWTILVGNTLANFVILGWIFTKLHEAFPARGYAVAGVFAGVVFVFYTLFDLLPKMLFRAHPNVLSMSAARAFRIINYLVGPLVLLVEDVSKMILYWTGGEVFKGQLFGNREEMRAVMRESGAVLTDDEHAMVNRILDLQNFSVGQVAKPLSEMVAVEAVTPLREALRIADAKGFSRLPVWEWREGERRVAGLLEVEPLLYRDTLDVEKSVSAYMIPAVFVHEGIRLEVALRLLRRGGRRLAIVLSRDRKEVGLVGVKDILRVMFGETKL